MSPHANHVRFGLDVAASSLYADDTYRLGSDEYSMERLHIFYANLLKHYPLLSVEDPFSEESFDAYAALLVAHPELMVIGDDLTTTNVARLNTAITEKSVNALIIKPNQIGTLSETLETMSLARAHQVHCIVSHRSAETPDTFIADLAYAFGCYGLKAGAPLEARRMRKYERLATLTA